MDDWTSVTTESFVTLTARSYVLQTRAMNERHMDANVAELFSSVVNEWKITKKDIITDNNINIVVTAELGHFVHLKCYANMLSLASQHVLKLPSVARLLGRVRCIATFFAC